MGKLALLATLLATLLWTEISGVDARHATIRRLLMIASTNTRKLPCQELSGDWAFWQARNREVDAAPCEAKRAKQAKLRAAVKEKRARARDKAKAEATMLECATFATCFAKTEAHMVWVCALAIHVRGAFLSCHSRVRRAYSAVAWRVAKNAPPFFCKPCTQCSVLGSDDQLANVACPGERQEAAGGTHWRHARVRAREDPWDSWQA